MSNVTVDVEREEHKQRYVLHFKSEKVNWFMFLKDEVVQDPLQFKNWLRRVVQEVQNKD